MTFWSTQTLQARLPGIVSPYHPDKTREASHMLSMGEQYLVTSDPEQKWSTESWINQLEDKKSFVIPPGQFAFLLTEEFLKIPKTAIGFIAIASKQNFRGLVNVSGFHVDPGYEGKLIFAVFNAGPKYVTVKKGDAIFRLWMSNLDEEDRASRRKRGDTPLTEIGSEIANNISGDVVSPQNLAIRFSKLQNDFQSLKTYFSVVMSILIAIFGAMVVALLLKAVGLY